MDLPSVSDTSRVRAFLSDLRAVAARRKNQRCSKKVNDDFDFDDIEFGKPLEEIPEQFKIG